MERNSFKKSNQRLHSILQEALPIEEYERDFHFFETLINEMSDELMLIRRDGRIIYVNEATSKALGYTRKALLNLSITDFFKNKMPLKKWQKEYFEKIKRRKSSVTARVERLAKNDKMQVIEVKAVYVTYHDEEFILSIARDITQRLNEETNLKETLESQKTAALYDFIWGTAQEINYPLKSIMGHTKKLSNKYRNRDFEYIGYKEFKDIMSNIENINNQMMDCYKTTNRLLNINKKRARVEHLHCDANGIIRNCLRMIEQQADLAGIKFKVQLCSKLPAVAIDAVELDLALKNIIRNAAQAMPSGGLITVKSSLNNKTNMVCLDVKDTGIGISKENIPRIFEPFFTTKQISDEKSTGMGLSTVHSILKAYHGDIVVKSNLRQGTSVKLFIPSSKDQLKTIKN